MKKITIVGNGTAGVICASFLKTFWKDSIEIELIHNSKIEIIGVGESTTPSIFEYLQFIGISTNELIKNTNCLLKLGIKFKNWNNDNKHFFHNFNEPNFSQDFINKTYFLSSAYSILQNKFDNDFYLQDYFLESNSVPSSYPDDISHALHIDAKKFSEYILEKFKDKITIIDDNIIKVEVENNNIKYLLLESGKKITSDLFIDASGFSKVLFKELNPKWIDMSDYLPLDRAIPNPIKKTYKHIPGFTLAESSKNGWIWQIPLQDRYGSGYNYSSKFTSDEEAKKDFDMWLKKNHKVNLENDRVIKYNSGYFKDQWIGNCVAVGLSSGFVEPLESTAIHTIIRQALYITNFYSLHLDDYSIKMYNKKLQNVYETIYDFIRLHYYTKRYDSDFHVYMNENTPEWILDLENKLNYTFINHFDFFDNDDLFTAINYITLCHGLGLIKSKSAIENYLSKNNFLDMSKTLYYQIKEIKKINRYNSVDQSKLISKIKNS
jgi:tryptophan halogenase